jgi:hypothetical protein
MLSFDCLYRSHESQVCTHIRTCILKLTHSLIRLTLIRHGPIVLHHTLKVNSAEGGGAGLPDFSSHNIHTNTEENIPLCH